MRVNKFLADKGYATRKGADTLILDGKVFVNGAKAVLGMKVSEQDKVEVRGNKKNIQYFAYYKPRGLLTSSAPEGEMDIKKSKIFPAPFFPVGRLDKDSEGLIIVTNDGRITERLLNPLHSHEKEYLVTVDKNLSETPAVVGSKELILVCHALLSLHHNRALPWPGA